MLCQHEGKRTGKLEFGKGGIPMKKLLVFILVLIFVLAIAGCKSDAPGGEIQLGREFDFSGITQVQLTNCHNGQATIITDEEKIAEIIAFVGEPIGKAMGSGKGFYEGSYSVVFSDENGETFSMAYGDDNVFYMGKGDDGYPIRYHLTNITISDDVIPFFSQYDKSSMMWDETK